MSAERKVIAIDRHKVWIEEPCALVCQIEGDVSGDNLRQMRDQLDFIGGGQGPVIVMQDLAKATSFSAAARKGILEDKRTQRVVVVICIGASFQMRVIMTMIVKAMKLIDTPVPTMLFADDDAKARMILAEQRAKLQQSP